LCYNLSVAKEDHNAQKGDPADDGGKGDAALPVFLFGAGTGTTFPLLALLLKSPKGRIPSAWPLLSVPFCCVSRRFVIYSSVLGVFPSARFSIPHALRT